MIVARNAEAPRGLQVAVSKVRCILSSKVFVIVGIAAPTYLLCSK